MWAGPASEMCSPGGRGSSRPRRCVGVRGGRARARGRCHVGVPRMPAFVLANRMKPAGSTRVAGCCSQAKARARRAPRRPSGCRSDAWIGEVGASLLPSQRCGSDVGADRPPADAWSSSRAGTCRRASRRSLSSMKQPRYVRAGGCATAPCRDRVVGGRAVKRDACAKRGLGVGRVRHDKPMRIVPLGDAGLGVSALRLVACSSAHASTGGVHATVGRLHVSGRGAFLDTAKRTERGDG